MKYKETIFKSSVECKKVFDSTGTIIGYIKAIWDSRNMKLHDVLLRMGEQQTSLKFREE